MSAETEDGDDLVAGAFFPVEPSDETAAARKQKFLPWHRPRKHFIRVEQWCTQTQKLVSRRKSVFASRALRYLGLPGDDLFDLRALHDSLSPLKVRLRYLGFNTVITADASVSLSEVNGLPFVDAAESAVLIDSFQRLANDNSLAHRQARNTAPFDVVNLDLCDSLISNHPESPDTLCKALINLIKLQKETDEWLLFITTRADLQTAHMEALARLLNCIVANSTNHSEFDSTLEESLGIRTAELASPEKLSQEAFALAFGLGIGKWLLKAANGAGPGWEVELNAQNFWYKVHGDGPDMLSLSFLFRRPATVCDVTGVSGSAAPPPPPKGELQLALAMLSKLVQISDPDTVLRDDENKRTKNLRRFMTMLTDARYDTDAYARWLEGQGEATPNVTAQVDQV